MLNIALFTQKILSNFWLKHEGPLKDILYCWVVDISF